MCNDNQDKLDNKVDEKVRICTGCGNKIAGLHATLGDSPKKYCILCAMKIKIAHTVQQEDK
jgi:hypothetical protein